MSDDRLADIWRQAWKPPDRRPAWLWAEEHVRNIPYSPVPGRFRSDNSPWIRAPLEALTDPRVRCISVIAAIQASKTLLAEVGSAYIIANMPGPMLWLDQTDDDAKDQSGNRLQPLYDEVEPVRMLAPADRHKKNLAVISWANGMTQWIKGAHSKTNLQRRSIRWLIGDETWRWPAGHMAEAEARVTAFGWLGKCLFTSQAGEVDDDTDLKHRQSTQEEWNYLCPACEKLYPWKWKNVEWSKDAREGAGWNFSEVRRTTVYRCPCGEIYEDSDRNRRRLNKGGEFVVMNPLASGEIRGFHWNGLCSSSWGMLAELYLIAKEAAKKGDTELLKIFYQKRLALSWEDHYEDFKLEIPPGSYTIGETWEKEAVILRTNEIVPKPMAPDTEDEEELEKLANILRGSSPLRFLTVDCQRDHFWAVVRAWACDGSSRLIDRRGGRRGKQSLLTWDDIENLQEEAGVNNRLVFVDAGYDTSNVYIECGRRGWTALMGDHRQTFAHRVKAKGQKAKVVERYYSPVKRVAMGNGITARVHHFSNLNAKDTLTRLHANQDPALGPTWEIPANVGDEYLRQMDSEKRIKKSSKYIWEQVGSRPNHYWDCETMQVCAALMLKLVGREAVIDTDKSNDGGD